MKKKLGLIIILISLISLLITACDKPANSLKKDSSPEKSPEAKNEEKPAINVRTSVVKKGDIREWITLFGNVQAESTVAVTPNTSGRLYAVYVKPGDNVRKGQRIAMIDPSRPGLQYALSPVEAPISGTITSVQVNIGEMTSPQTAIALVGILNQLEVELLVAERFVFKLKPGRTGTVSTEALPGFSQDVIVSEISPVINPVSRTATVKLSLVNDQGILKPGMYVDIRLLLDDKKNVLLTSEKALIQRDEQTFVFINKEGSAERIRVEPGIRSEGKVEILSGLNAGDIVITSGKNLLYNGAPVSVLDEEEL